MHKQPDLASLLTAIWERLAALTDHVMDTNDKVSKIESRLAQGDSRMADIERRQKINRGSCMGLVLFLKEIASIKEWLAGAALVFLAVRGAMSPGEMKLIILQVLGVGPLQ